MIFSDAKAQCMGNFTVANYKPALQPTCIDCKRRTAKALAQYQWWMQGVVLDGKCKYKIKD
jgi:hypothetical protein